MASEGDEWKKYRKITAPAFSDVSYCYFPDPILSGLPIQRNNKLVWTETVKIMESLFKDAWEDKKVISMDHCVDLTLPVCNTNASNSVPRLRFPP